MWTSLLETAAALRLTNYQSSLNLWRQTFAEKDWETLIVDDCVVFAAQFHRMMEGRTETVVAQFLRLIGAEAGKVRCFKVLATALREILPSWSGSRDTLVCGELCEMRWLGAKNSTM